MGEYRVNAQDAYSPSSDDRLKAAFFPEVSIGGFSHVDGTVAMYNQVASLIRPNDVVLEFGAGRGGNISTDPSPYRRWLQTLRGRCERLVGCDIDDIVSENPYIDEAVVIHPGKPLPFPDASFDLIVSNNVFEHVAEAEQVAAELLRVLKPGGTLCASTPNKFGYVALAAMLVRNTHHVAVLKRVQPQRLAVDVFPTLYRMNTPAIIQRLFGHAADVMIYMHSAEPSYHFGNRMAFGLFKLLHKLLPERLAVTMYIFVRKHQSAVACPA